jgi:hypothetical protein
MRACNYGEEDIQLIRMAIALYGIKRLLIEYAGMGRGKSNNVIERQNMAAGRYVA